MKNLNTVKKFNELSSVEMQEVIGGKRRHHLVWRVADKAWGVYAYGIGRGSADKAWAQRHGAFGS